MRNLTRNDGRPKRAGGARIARRVCTWVSLSCLIGCAVPGVDLSGRACPCVDDWVCDEQTQLCVAGSRTEVEFSPQEEERWDDEPLDGGGANPPDEPVVDGATSFTDAETTFADAETNVTPGDAGHGNRGDAGFVDADTPDANTPDATYADAGQEAGVIIPPEPDAGSDEPCEHGTTMRPGERRGVAEDLCSPSGQYRFGLRPNGSLELRTSQAVIWSSGNCCGISLAMQRDGNLVAYDSASAPVFATNTRGNDGAFLTVEDDGRAKLWLGSTVIWSTTR